MAVKPEDNRAVNCKSNAWSSIACSVGSPYCSGSDGNEDKDEGQTDPLMQSRPGLLATHSHTPHGQTDLLALFSSLFPQASCFQSFPRSEKSFSN